MSRAWPTALALFTVLACTANGQTPGSPSVAVATATLTARAPTTAFALPAGREIGSVLVLSILRIENPERQPFSVHAVARWHEAGHATERILGNVTPYPADNPGTFLLRVDSEVTTRLAEAIPSAVVEISIQPIASGRELRGPLTVVVATPAWR